MSRIVHFEIPATEPEKTVEFFRKTFGWNINKWGEEEYWLISTGDPAKPGIDGAILRRRAPDMPVVNTIEVDDIDASMLAVQENGGTIVVPKTTIPGIGHQCYFKDPDGVIHGILQNDPAAK